MDPLEQHAVFTRMARGYTGAQHFPKYRSYRPPYADFVLAVAIKSNHMT